MIDMENIIFLLLGFYLGITAGWVILQIAYRLGICEYKGVQK